MRHMRTQITSDCKVETEIAAGYASCVETVLFTPVQCEALVAKIFRLLNISTEDGRDPHIRDDAVQAVVKKPNSVAMLQLARVR